MPGTGAAIAEAVRSGLRTARQVVEQYLEVAERLNPELNAFVEIDRAGALERADSVDAGLRAGSPAGPLCGVPIALKDLVDHAGHVTTAGSAFYRHEATRSATVVRRLEAAGAIIIGRTGCTSSRTGSRRRTPGSGRFATRGIAIGHREDPLADRRRPWRPAWHRWRSVPIREARCGCPPPSAAWSV